MCEIYYQTTDVYINIQSKLTFEIFAISMTLFICLNRIYAYLTNIKCPSLGHGFLHLDHSYLQLRSKKNSQLYNTCICYILEEMKYAFCTMILKGEKSTSLYKFIQNTYNFNNLPDKNTKHEQKCFRFSCTKYKNPTILSTFILRKVS